MYQIKIGYILPDGDTINNVLEFQEKTAAEEAVDRWYRAYNTCLDNGEIIEFFIVMTEIREMFSVFSSR